MIRIEVFDPPMCCSTGVCGPDVDPVLPRFAADLEWLRQQGVRVTRYNMSQQPAAFAENEAVKKALQDQGNACLPLVLMGAEVISSGEHPDRETLAAMIPGLNAAMNKPVEKETQETSCCSGTGCC